MKTQFRSPSLLSRRTVLGAAVASVGLSAVPTRLLAGVPDTMPPVAVVFDGDFLIVAAQNLFRNNGSASWETLSSPKGGTILSFATHPKRPGRILACLASGGVSMSEDGGRTWNSRAAGLPTEAALAIAVAAALPDTIYVAIKGDGVWKSEDVGLSWSFAMDRPWLEEAERDPLTLASVNLATGMGGIWIYAGTEIGLTRVPDCFCRWQDVKPSDAMDALVSGTAPQPEIPLPVGEPIRALVSAPSSPETLYAALPSGVWFSRNAGVIWSRVMPGVATAVAIHPVNVKHIVAVVDGNLKQSRDSGVNWSALAAI
jgi:hypothetical protein